MIGLCCYTTKSPRSYLGLGSNYMSAVRSNAYNYHMETMPKVSYSQNLTVLSCLLHIFPVNQRKSTGAIC